ncbi:hypothetical protein [Nonomuraea africana]|uniref:hypothetical protein n=1 Tax=Nonomuraea africana TaxID=46171 RepID=UPI0033E95DB3
MWALNSAGGAPPEGDLDAARGLLDPGQEITTSVARVAAATAARLRLQGPPLDDPRPPGRGVVLLAAAVGARGERRAAELARVVPPPRTAYDLLSYHAVAGAAVPYAEGLADVLRDSSPLTGTLDRPGPSGAPGCDELIDRLRSDGPARRLLTLRFAAPVTDPAQYGWRGETLAWLRHEDVGLVLDVYENALVHHRAEHERMARAAWRAALAGDADAATPVATWWRALAELESAAPAMLRARRQLLDYHEWTNLFRRVRTMEART